MVHLRRRKPDRQPGLTPWGFYAAPPARRRRDPLRTLAVGAALSLVLAVGGCVVSVGSMARDVGDAWTVTQAPAAATTRQAVQVGRPFALAGFRVAPGWALGQTPLGAPTITGLQVTSAAEEPTSLRYAFTFRRGSTWLAEVDCWCPTVNPGATAVMACFPTTPRPPLGYDTVVVADSF